MKKLSVIVPIYNAETTLRKCIESIISQEYANLEIILIDDGSKDKSIDICNEYAKKDSRIVVHHKENAGLVAARKTGVELATGEYIGFVDSDDYIDSDMYLSLMDDVQKNNSDIVIGGIILDYADHSVKSFNKLPIGVYDKQSISKQIVPNLLMKTGFYQFGIIPGVVVKVFKKQNIQESLKKVSDGLTLGEDVAITSFSIINAESISIIEKASYHYIQTDTSMIRGYNPKRFQAICKMYECICQIEESSYIQQTGAYFACVLYGVLSDCVKNKNFTKREAIDQVYELLNHKTSQMALHTANVSDWGLQDKIKFFMMKHKMVRLLTAWLAR